MDSDAIIVGGGIAGLATAFELQRRGMSTIVLERASRPGGVILSEEIDGFTIDAGPDALLIQKPEGIKLCEELGLADRLVSTKPPRLAYIQRGGVLHPLPAASVLGIPTRIGPFLSTNLFSWPGKLRMGAELFIPARRETTDESIGAFITRRFGREATEFLAEPLLAGIHAGDVNRLSLLSLFPRFAEAERRYGSLLRAFRAQRRAVEQRPPSGVERRESEGAFKSLKGGLSVLVRTIVDALPRGAVRLSTPVLCVSTGDGDVGYRVDLGGRTLTSRSLVLACPAFAVAEIVRGLDGDLAELCREVPYASIATVALAFPREAVGHPLNGSGYVVPRTEGGGILAVTWLSSKWPERAPEGMVSLRTFIGGARDPSALEFSDTELVTRSFDAIRPILAVRGDPLFARVYRFERANAQHEVGHLARMARIDERLLLHPGLFVTGSGFRGVGIPDCVADARSVGGQVAAWLAKAATAAAAPQQRTE